MAWHLSATEKYSKYREEKDLSFYKITSYRIERYEEIKNEWEELERKTECSYFQSWGWIGTWLEQIAVDLNPVLIKVWKEKDLIGLGVFIRGRLHRHKIINSNALFLNEFPYDGRNMVIEYNGILINERIKQPIYQKTISLFFKEDPELDEIYLGAIADQELTWSLDEMRNPGAGWNIKENFTSISRSIDLTAFESGIDGFLSSLSKNRRNQIKKSIRLYEQQGPLQLSVAEDLKEAEEYFNGLKELHTIRWNRDGKTGSFSNCNWEKFHRALIVNRFCRGEIQLLKVCCGQVVIGYLYNFIWRNHVYVLQTGFKLSEDKRLMPGYVVHLLAIVFNQSRSMIVYDLMHGDAVYKKILCNQETILRWYVAQRKCLKFRLENSAVASIRYLKNLETKLY